MNKSALLPFFLLILIGCASVKKDSHPVDLNGILEKYASENYKLNPLSATANNIHDYNDQLAIDIGEVYTQNLLTLNKRYLDTLKTLNYNALAESEKLSVDILTHQLILRNEGLVEKYAINRPLDQFVFSFPQRFAVLGSGAGYIPFKTEKDYRNFISRMKSFSVWIDQAIANMQRGLQLKDTNPKASMAKVSAQLKPLFESEVEDNVFYRPLLTLPTDIDSASRRELIADYKEAINTHIRPAYKKLNDYLEQIYVPQARETAGLLDNYNGQKEYSYCLRSYTGTSISPDEIFELGLSEVSRIRHEMDSLKVLTGFKGDLSEFFHFIRTDSSFFQFETAEEVLDRYRSFEARMEPQLKSLFNLRPKSKFEVRATEKFREAGANAQYMRPSRDGIRPGIFYETVRNPKEYNYFAMESLFIHEAIPGHHYQLSIQQETEIPEFRKSLYDGAYMEGWALYAESLGTALGMYKDPYQYVGRLNSEMERAVRLVVDAGIHHKGWTREKAIAYVLENQPVTELVAEQRIERYMVTPGQAVTYKVGELKILELRKKAQQRLGDKFTISEFHDQVLKDGVLPLSILEKQIDNWIARKTANETRD